MMFWIAFAFPPFYLELATINLDHCIREIAECLKCSVHTMKLVVVILKKLTYCRHFLNIQVIAESLSEEEIGGLKELFKMIDTDNSGTITFDELKDGLKRVGSELTENEIQALMEAVSAPPFTSSIIIPCRHALWILILPFCTFVSG